MSRPFALRFQIFFSLGFYIRERARVRLKCDDRVVVVLVHRNCRHIWNVYSRICVWLAATQSVVFGERERGWEIKKECWMKFISQWMCVKWKMPCENFFIIKITRRKFNFSVNQMPVNLWLPSSIINWSLSSPTSAFIPF